MPLGLRSCANVLVDRPWRVVLLRYATIIARRELSHLVSLSCLIFLHRENFYSPSRSHFSPSWIARLEQGAPSPLVRNANSTRSREIYRVMKRVAIIDLPSAAAIMKRTAMFLQRKHALTWPDLLFIREVVRLEWRNVGAEKNEVLSLESKGNGTFSIYVDFYIYERLAWVLTLRWNV